MTELEQHLMNALKDWAAQSEQQQQQQAELVNALAAQVEALARQVETLAQDYRKVARLLQRR